MKICETWTIDGYWTAVLGCGSPSQVVAEYALDPADRRGLDEWLGHAEAVAWAAGAEGGDGATMPVEWEGFHLDALDDLCSVTPDED